MKVIAMRVFALALTWTLCHAPTSAASGTSWSISQFCQPYGSMRVDIGQNGARFASNRLTILMSANRPTRIYNNNSKSYCEVTSASASKKFSFMTTPGQPVKGASKNLLNLRATQYWCGGFDKKGRMVYSTECWTTNDLNLPSTYTDKYLKMCGLPTGLGMPLQVFRHYGDVKNPAHEKTMFIDTFKYNSANLPASNFAEPSGYKLASEMEVLIGDQLE